MPVRHAVGDTGARSARWRAATAGTLTPSTSKELVASEHNFSANAQLTVFTPSEVELGETTEAMIAVIDEIRPQRVVLDSLSELRLIAQSPLRYRRQVLALKQFFAGRDCTGADAR